MRYLPGLLAIAVIVSIAGCSSSGGGTAPGGGAVPGVTSSGAGVLPVPTGSTVVPAGGASSGSHSTAATPLSAGGGKLPNVCTLVTSAELSAAAGAKYGKAGPIPGSQIDECHWNGSLIGLDITLWNFGTMSSFQTMLSGASSKDAPLVTISGVGQHAIASAAGLVVQVNSSEFVQVEGAPGEIFGKHAADIAIAKLVISKLG